MTVAPRSLASRAVDQDRLLWRHRLLAAIGATPDGGVSREALTEEDLGARRLLLSWAAQRGFRVAMDSIGNTFVRRSGADDTLAPVVTGSHVDSQPAGGAFDGAYGVVAAWEALEAIDDAGLATVRPIELAIWTNEEGSRFHPTTMGSAVFTGALDLDDVMRTADASGETFGAALPRLLAAFQGERREFQYPMHAFIEAHIEQGPLLELAKRTIGVVRTIQGLRWFTVRVQGKTGHAGTMPRALRRDAAMTAVDILHALSELMHDPADLVRFTVGRIDVAPGSPNTIPDHVLFTIDFRHPDAGILADLGDRVVDTCRANAGNCRVDVTESLSSPPTSLDSRLTRLVASVAGDLELPWMEIDSGATHDAKNIATHCSTGMIFIPCRQGVSHTPEEYAEPEDMAAGARVLAGVLAELAQDPDRAGP